jgi:hypothetical protein
LFAPLSHRFATNEVHGSTATTLAGTTAFVRESSTKPASMHHIRVFRVTGTRLRFRSRTGSRGFPLDLASLHQPSLRLS